MTGTIELTTSTRAGFLVRGALAVAGAAGAGAVGPFVASAVAKGGGGDVDILNLALTLEYVEVDFYKAAIPKLSGKVKARALEFLDQQNAHVAALKSTISDLGGTAAKRPRTKISIADEAAFLKTAVALEDAAVSAYNGAGVKLKSKDVLAAAGGIVQAEARHAAVWRVLAGKQPAPGAFDTSLDAAGAKKALAPFLA
jgi:Ferritin-like domain